MAKDFYIHFQTNTLEKGMNPRILTNYELNMWCIQ